MKLRRALISFFVITAIYLAALIWLDASHQVFSAIPRLLSALPVLAGLSFSTYVLRYLRWYWLLWRAGNRTPPVRGFLVYLAGFAFTATPGKVGELLRIRYLLPCGVPAWKVIAAFVYERAFDLLVVLLLASLFVRRADLFALVSLFVVACLGAVLLIAFYPGVLTRLSALLRLYGLTRLSRLGVTLRDGLAGFRIWATPADVALAAGLGVAAWGLASFAFVWLLHQIGIAVPLPAAAAIYPLALLAGAASMLPGGVGSTEAAIVALLALFNVPLAPATLSAVGIRLASLWFAVVCGFISVALLELSPAATGMRLPTVSRRR